ncbi:nucleopolyhedrovirus P10 family protein [Streptomyces macrosporus]|uniref:Nucleopolyhedrovirus P10 family protein n=1 Tax=Streptomyces macrosporus TaxID=44032 RepID=A0ABN3KHG8_9ACTN
MGVDRLAQTVRRQLGLGRLLPLGEAADGAWLMERAAVGVLRQAAGALRGVRPGRTRIDLADPDTAGRPLVPPPPSALPPGPLRIEAEFEAGVDRPLPVTAERLRAVLAGAADSRMGLVVSAVDLRITGLLEEPQDAPERESPSEAAETHDALPGDGGPPCGGSPDAEDVTDPEAAGGAEAAVRAAVLAVPGVARLAPALGHGDRPVWIEDALPGDRGGAPPGRHVRIQLAISAEHRVLDVVRAARAAVASAAAAGAPGSVTVAVVVTEVTDLTRVTDPARVTGAAG